MGMIPRSRRFRIAGIFDLGLYEIDSSSTFVALDVGEHLLNKETPDFIELRVADIYQAPAIADRLSEEFGPQYMTQDWADMNRSLFSALGLEKMAISITIGLIVAVAALNIIASLVLLVMEKSRDIAILKTMGASSRSIMIVFMLQGLVIGLVGTAAGAALGVSLSYVLDRYELIKVPTDVYQVSHVPFHVLPLDFAVVVLAAVVICFLATLYPSRQAARLDPVQALRFE
jgi:lipoprotein-releasing system permease protein